MDIEHRKAFDEFVSKVRSFSPEMIRHNIKVYLDGLLVLLKVGKTKDLARSIHCFK